MAEGKFKEVFLTALLTDSDLIRILTGKEVQEKEEAVLDGYDLVIQRIDQVPTPAQAIMRESWGDNFESYNLASGQGSIKGIACKVTEDQWDRLRDWEFEEFGWFVSREVGIRNPNTGETKRVLTMVMGEGQQYDRKANGLDFAPFLMPKEKTLEVAAKARALYDKRRKGSVEKDLF